MQMVQMDGMKCVKCLESNYKDYLADMPNQVKCPTCGDVQQAEVDGAKFSKMVAKMGRDDELINKLLQLHKGP